MFYLGGSNFPATRAELTTAVVEGLRGLFTLPAGSQVVRIDGSSGAPGDPALACGPANLLRSDRVVIDLTGARVDADRLPPEPKGVGQNRPAAVAALMEIGAHPLTVRGAPVELSLSATCAKFDFDRDATGKPLLLLTDAKDGKVIVQIRQRDLDGLVLSAAREAAATQGVQIVDTQLSLTQADDRSVSAEVRIKAKKMFLSAVVTVRGNLRIDENLNAVASNLTCTGEGMLGDLACNAIRPKLQQIAGRNFALTALSLGQVRLRDLRVKVGETMSVTAAFGS